MEEKIKNILEKILQQDFSQKDLKEINMETCKNWDSLAHLKIIISLEEEFDTEIEPDEIYLMKEGALKIKEIIEDKLK